MRVWVDSPFDVLFGRLLSGAGSFIVGVRSFIRCRITGAGRRWSEASIPSLIKSGTMDRCVIRGLSVSFSSLRGVFS